MLKYFKHHFHSIASLVIRGLSVLAGFGVTYYIGHYLGPAANGQYALIAQTAMFLSVVAVGGIDLAVVKEFSAGVAKKLPLNRRTFFATTSYSMTFAIAIIAFLLLGGAPLLARISKDVVPDNLLVVLCVMLLARTLTRLMSAVLRSQRDYILGQTVEVLFIPGFVLLAIMTGLIRTLDELLWCTAVGGIISGIIGVVASLRFTRTQGETHTASMRGILKMAGPLWGVAIALNIADWYSLATVAAVLGMFEAGIYRVALQMGSMLSIVSMGLYGVFSAQIGVAFAAQDKPEVARLARSATMLSLVMIMPATILLFLFARPILSIVGPEFAQGATILRIMVVGQAIYTITGPSGLVLALTGHERVNLLITTVSTVSLLIVAPVAAHLAGLIGITLYVALILVGRNIASLYAMKKLEGINCITGKLNHASFGRVASS
ncbi:MAG: oligosaccharide flippase family protein [Sphingobium sp.]